VDSAPQVLHDFHLFERRLEQHRRIAHGFKRGPASMFGVAARELSCYATRLTKVTRPLVLLPDALQRCSIALACFSRFFSPLPETFRRRSRARHFVPLWSRDILLRHDAPFSSRDGLSAVAGSTSRRRDLSRAYGLSVTEDVRNGTPPSGDGQSWRTMLRRDV
jgi:hypothetical protein